MKNGKKRGRSQTARDLDRDRKDDLKKKIPPEPLLKHFTCITANVQQLTMKKWVSILAHPQAHTATAIVPLEHHLDFCTTPKYKRKSGWELQTVCGPLKKK